jgi:hypothetical protein
MKRNAKIINGLHWEAMDGEKEKRGIPFEGIDYSECRGQCGTLPCCGPCMKEKNRLAEEAEIAKRASKYQDCNKK